MREEARLSETYVEWWDDPTVLQPNPWTEVPSTRSILARTETDLAMWTETNSLPPGHLVQPWYGAFHNPEKCETPYMCTRLDIANDRTGFTSVSGRIIATVDDSGWLRTASKPAHIGDGTYTRFGQGILDMVGAEIHGFLRDKGPINPELFSSQRGGVDGLSYDGGCKLSGVEGANFECYVPQLSRHYRQIAGQAVAATRTLSWCEHEGDPRSGEVVSSSSRSVVISNPHVAIGFVDTRGLIPGNAVSLWWAVFGAPDACAAGAGGCTIADLGNPNTDPKVIDAKMGDIVGEDGTLLQVASPVFSEDLDLDSQYELLLVLRDHGPYNDDHYYRQQFALNEGCDTDGSCIDVQYARHESGSVIAN